MDAHWNSFEMRYSTITAFTGKPQQASMADIIRRMGRNATIVTGNQRLARSLRQHYNQSMIEEGRATWPTPDILPWNAWLLRLWQEAVVTDQTASELFLLNTHQERLVWQQILQTADPSLTSLADGLTVTSIMEAKENLRAWQIPLDSERFAYNEDSRFFCRVFTVFERNCEEQGWLTITELPDVLLPLIQKGNFALPEELVLLGFDELTPQQMTFLQGLSQAGCEAVWLQFIPESARIGRLACVDSRDELRQATQWIRRKLEQNPEARIGLIVPELSTQRALVCRMLDEMLCPAALEPGNHELPRPYNLSLGLPLIQYPLIHIAFDCLTLSVPVAELMQVSRLLRSSFLAGYRQESNARALLDAHLRQTGQWMVSLQSVIHHASQIERAYHCPVLVQHLKQLLELAKVRPEMGTPGEWQQQFSQWLTAAGWPGDHPLTSVEFQVMQAWQSLLRQFAALDWVAQPMTLAHALDRLREMAAGTIFQPESPPVSIQVLGLLETSGLKFDHLWMMGLHDGVLPAAPKPNPFIPFPLQRDRELPKSTAGRELRVAKAVLQRLVGCAPEIVISYPQRQQDTLLIPSPLIVAYPPLADGATTGDTPLVWQQLIRRKGRLQLLTEDPAPSLTESVIPGGSRAFKLQAACPFLAFAELRLDARELGRIQLGLSVQMRGILLHRSMEKIWASLKSYDRLLATPIDRLDDLIVAKVTEAIQETAPGHRENFSKRLQMLELARLSSLVRAWLEYEKQRPPFKIIELEKAVELMMGGRWVHVRIDRIDVLSHGKRLLIDYKTGTSKVDGWFGERPDEPQLPLYSLHFAEELVGIAFAQIKTGEITFKGVASDETSTPGIVSFRKLPLTRNFPDWPAVTVNWRQMLERLAMDFIAGKAEADPKQYPQTCTNCALRPLCRIDEKRMGWSDEQSE